MMMLWFFGLVGCTVALGPRPSSHTPDMVEFYQQKALALELRGELQQALLAWHIANGLAPDNQLMPRIIANLSATIEKLVPQHFAEGLAHYGNGKYDDARRAFLRTLRLSPDHPQALDYLKRRLHLIDRKEYVVQKGDSFSKIALNTYHDAGKAYVIAYFNDLNPDKPLLTGTRLILPDLSDVAVKPRGEKPTAKPVREVGDEPLPDTGLNDAENYQRGLDLMAKKRYVDALAALITVSPDFSGREKALEQARHLIRGQEIETAMQEAQFHLERKEFQSACDMMETIVAQAADHPVAMQLLNQARRGRARELIGQEKEMQAIEILEALPPIDQDGRELLIQARARLNARAESNYRRGVKYFLNEDLERAVQAWKKTLILNPNHPKAAGDMENALRLLKKWQDLNAPQTDDSRSP